MGFSPVKSTVLQADTYWQSHRDLSGVNCNSTNIIIPSAQKLLHSPSAMTGFGRSSYIKM